MRDANDFDLLADQTGATKVQKNDKKKDKGDDADKAGGKAKKDDLDDEEESEGFEDDEFTDIRLLWSKFMKNGSIKKDKQQSLAPKPGAKADAAEPADDEAALLGDGEDVNALNINPYEEDPVQPEFEMQTTCTSDDKDKENKQKSARRGEMKLLFEKLRKI